MKLLFTKNFIRDYRKLPEDVQTALDKQLELLLANSKHPSLAVKLWEIRTDLILDYLKVKDRKPLL